MAPLFSAGCCSSGRAIEGVKYIAVLRANQDPDTRFATYGTLRPGGPNHDQLEGLKGQWRSGTVRGKLVEAGWGAELGFPALILDDFGSAIEVSLLDSPDLPRHWSRLDEFEGPEYRRVIAHIDTADGAVSAWIYVAAG